MKKIKILITSPSLDTTKNIGGISNLTKLLINYNEDVEYFHYIIGKEDSQRRNIKWLFSQIFILIEFYKTLSKRKIEITHINYPLSELSIIINYILIIISKVKKVNNIIHLRGGVLSLNENILFYQKWIVKKSITLSNKVIVLGEKEKRFLTDFYKVPEDKIFVLPNSVKVPELDYIKHKISQRESDDTKKILFLGRIDKDKGLKEIIKSLRTIDVNKKFEFLLAGTGPDKEWFISECQKYIKEKFKYLGILNYEEKIKILNDSDIFILPSYFEGLPNGLLEAMAFGLVPIVTNVGSIPEVVTNEYDGYIIEPHDFQTLKNKIETLLNDKKLIQEMSLKAHEKIVSRYSLYNYIQNLNIIYNVVHQNNSL